MANTLDNIVLQESDLLDSDIRLLIHKKRTDPAFTLTDHVRKKLKENTTTTPPASTSALAMRRSKSGLPLRLAARRSNRHPGRTSSRLIPPPGGLFLRLLALLSRRAYKDEVVGVPLVMSPTWIL